MALLFAMLFTFFSLREYLRCFSRKCKTYHSFSVNILLSQSKAGAASDYVRGEDVLDIWFDSGASWAAVLEGTFEVSSVCPVMQIM